MKKEQKHIISEEIIFHFRCGVCDRWWSVGDAPQVKKEWFCPWCGVKQKDRFQNR